MHLPLPLTTTLLLLPLLPLISSLTTSYDTGYDDPTRSLSTVACSDGPNGLLTKGYTTQSSLPSFPNIGGASVVGGWNSVNCGTCWTLTYEGNSVSVLVIDSAVEGFNIGEEAMNALTGGQAVALGRVDAAYVQVDKSVCGL